MIIYHSKNINADKGNHTKITPFSSFIKGIISENTPTILPKIYISLSGVAIKK